MKIYHLLHHLIFLGQKKDDHKIIKDPANGKQLHYNTISVLGALTIFLGNDGKKMTVTNMKRQF